MRLISIIVACLAAALPARAQFAVGEPFPEIVLPSVADGSPMSLSAFRGRKVVLHVFASW